MNKLDKALSLVDERRIQQLAKELIRVPSVTGEEKDVTYKAKTFLEDSGINVTMRGSPLRPIMISTINPKMARLLVFNGHLDTVQRQEIGRRQPRGAAADDRHAVSSLLGRLQRYLSPLSRTPLQRPDGNRLVVVVAGASRLA